MATGTKRRGYETVRDMVLSLAVILAGVVGFVALQPKHDHDPVPVVDYKPQVDLLSRNAAYPVFVPDPLPPGWQVNYARIATAGTAQLHMGFVLDRKRFAQLDETDRAEEGFLDAAKVPAQPAGTVTAAGQTYEVRRDDSGTGTGTGTGTTVALVRNLPDGALLTLSNGGIDNGASVEELTSLAAALRPQPKT